MVTIRRGIRIAGFAHVEKCVHVVHGKILDTA